METSVIWALIEEDIFKEYLWKQNKQAKGEEDQELEWFELGEAIVMAQEKERRRITSFLSEGQNMKKRSTDAKFMHKCLQFLP